MNVSKQPESGSEVRRSKIIVVLDIVEASGTAWRPIPAEPANQWREVALTTHLAETLKGAVDARQGTVLRFSIAQKTPVSGRIADDYGPWSDIYPEVKQRLLAYANPPSPKSTLEQTLVEGCDLVHPIDDPTRPHAIEDVRMAAELERRPGFPHLFGQPDVVDALMRRRSHLGPVAARFLVDAGEQAGPATAFPVMVRLALEADVPPLSRLVLFSALASWVVDEEEVAVARRIELVRLMLSILREDPSHAGLLHDIIRQGELADTVFQDDGDPYVTVDSVLPEAARRERAFELLQRRGMNEEDLASLREWLGLDLESNEEPSWP